MKIAVLQANSQISKNELLFKYTKNIVVHENSLDEDNRKFIPDEVFETVDEARETSLSCCNDSFVCRTV